MGIIMNNSELECLVKIMCLLLIRSTSNDGSSCVSSALTVHEVIVPHVQHFITINDTVHSATVQGLIGCAECGNFNTKVKKLCLSTHRASLWYSLAKLMIDHGHCSQAYMQGATMKGVCPADYGGHSSSKDMSPVLRANKTCCRSPIAQQSNISCHHSCWWL